jgi:enoyl-CoA hydratase/carnithine racemase
MELKTIRYGVDRAIATITLDRPHRLNAWTGRMHTEYRWDLAQAEASPTVRVVIVTGAGRGFCAGADSGALSGHVEKGGYDPGTHDDLATPGFGVRPEFDHDFAFHFGLTKPVIAAINGPAAGVGFVLACYCDVRFAAAGAKLTTSHGRLHLPAEYGLSWLLPRLIGVGRANDLLLSSRVRAGRRGRGHGAGQPGGCTCPVDGRRARVRHRPGDNRVTGFAGGHQAAGVRGPPSGRWDGS